MYKKETMKQLSVFDFNQAAGIYLDPNNRWIKLADMIPWQKFEDRYAKLFSENKGNVAKPVRLALGCLIIQQKFKYSDEEMIEQLKENAYLQFFVGLTGFHDHAPLDKSTLTHFRKRLSADIINEVNDEIIKEETQRETEEEIGIEENRGDFYLDATCAPSNIAYPQDFQLLSKSREKLEKMIVNICHQYQIKTPRYYPKEARKNYLSLAKLRKKSVEKIRKVIRKQLGYVERDLCYIKRYLEAGAELREKDCQTIKTIIMIAAQQRYMYENKTHVVENRIVSIDQPWIRPIVRGKANAPVEFGTKFELSRDEQGNCRIEKFSFNPYNESSTFGDAIEHYRAMYGHYPKRALVDQIYRTRKNREYCKERGIRMSGPKLGRPSQDNGEDKAISRQDNIDRNEIERVFSLGKRCYGLGLIRTKLMETTKTSIAISVLTLNLFRKLREEQRKASSFVLWLFQTIRQCWLVKVFY